MKFLKLSLLVAVIAAFFFSCSKENSVFGPMTGKLLTSVSGECLPVNVHGEYYVNARLNEDNYIDVQVDVAATGLYSLRTDTVNGLYFSGSGRVGLGGVNTIRLYPGDSTAKATGITSLTVYFDSIDSLNVNTLANSCGVDVEVLDPMANPSVFTLGLTPGNCSGAILGGTYLSGTALTAANTITLDVNVLSQGGYDISTPAINGVTFRAVGVFSSTGVQKVKLIGSGTPTASGLFNFPVSAISSKCSFSLAFSSGTGGGTTSVFTLGGSPGACTGATTAGTFITGTALTAANILSVQVNVTVPGTYSISTNSVNGITFSKSGTFASVGAQTIDLAGNGIPTTAGTNNYTITTAGGNCTASVTVTQGTTPPPPTSDCKACSYQPWCNGMKYTQQTTYLGSTTEKTTTISFIKDTTIDGKVFQKTSDQSPTPIYYNCSNGVTTIIVYNATTVSGMVTVSKLEQTLLKSNESVGATWANTLELPSFDPSLLQLATYDWTLAEKIATRTVLGVTYSDVIRVHLVLSSEIPGFIPKTKTSESDYYYANGIGLIETVTLNSQTGNTDFHQELKSYFIP